MSLLFKLENLTIRIEKAVVTLLVGLMVALSFLQLVLRLGFSQSILWLDPLLRHFVLWAGFFGAALASGEGRHFALDITQKMLPDKMRRPSAIAVTLFCSAICACLVYAGVLFIRDEIAADSVAFDIGSWQVKGWWLELILPLGFALILFHTLAGLARTRAGQEGQ